MTIKIRAGKLPDTHQAHIDKTRKGFSITVSRDGLTPATAGVLTASLRYVTRKMRRWDVRSKPVMTVGALLIGSAFACGIAAAPDTVRDGVRRILIETPAAEAATGNGAHESAATEPVPVGYDQPVSLPVPERTRQPTRVTQTTAAKNQPTTSPDSAPNTAPTTSTPTTPTTEPTEPVTSTPTEPAPEDSIKPTHPGKGPKAHTKTRRGPTR